MYSEKCTDLSPCLINALTARLSFVTRFLSFPHFTFTLLLFSGLKGTSKSVLYRCIWNENLLFRPNGEADPLTMTHLQHLTYWQSFQYATASKAPRLPAVLQYASRLANVTIGFMPYLFIREHNRDKRFIDHHVDGDDNTMYRQANGDTRVMPMFNSFAPLPTGVNFHGTNSVPFHPHVSA
jgi:hypothetical protein